MLAQWLMQSKAGPLYLVASPKGLKGAFWKKQTVPMIESLNGSEPEVLHIANAVKQLEEYFAGHRRDFDLELDVDGTEFQKRVWSELSKIPYGKTVSYLDIAKRLKNEKAVRAVGTANGRNPLSIIVPCHRVVGSNGQLTGYAGGLNAKSVLLNLEHEIVSI